MVLTALRYLNYFRSFSFLNIDTLKSLQTQNHDDVRCHDSSKLVNADSLIIAFSYLIESIIGNYKKIMEKQS